MGKRVCSMHRDSTIVRKRKTDNEKRKTTDFVRYDKVDYGKEA